MPAAVLNVVRSPADIADVTSGLGVHPGGVLPRRIAVVGAALALLVLVAALVPGPVGDLGVAVAVSVAFLGALVLSVRAARRARHPRVWRWYVAALLVAGIGAALAIHLPGSTVPMTVGALPGIALTLFPLSALVPRGARRALRDRLLVSLALFFSAVLLCALGLFELVSGRTLGHTDLFDLTLIGLGGLLALMIALGLLAVVSTHGRARRVAALALAGQANISAALVFMAFSDEARAATPPLVATSVCAVAGLGFLLSAAVTDGGPQTGTGPDAGTSALTALLPHGTVTAAGLVLIAGVLVHDRLSTAQAVIAAAVLLLLAVHQALTWRESRDLTHRLQRSEAFFRTVVRSAVDAVVILDDELRIRWSSPSFTDMLGWSQELLIGRDIRSAVHPADHAAITAGLLDPQSTDAAEGRTVTGRVRHADGRWRLIQARIRDLRADPDVGAIVLYERDITRDDTSATRATQLTGGTDAVTGLPDRSALVARIADVVRTGGLHPGAVPGARPTALVKVWVAGLADLHRGTTAPPDVVTEVAGRLARVLRAEDWLARSGPQEFAVLLDGTISDAETLAHRLTATVPSDLLLGGLRLSASAGVTSVEDDDREAVEVLRRASLAMVSARTAGPGRVRRHSVALLIAQNRQDALRADLDRALDRGELRMVYQPVVDLALQRTGSVEALVRWQHPTWGPVAPSEFIPLAEESTLIIRLGRWIMHTATRAIAELGDPDLCVAVNVSARHVRSGELLADVMAALADSGLPAHRLVLELTESVLLDESHVVDELAALRRLGVRIAVDDFGTGWSSLAYLVGLPVDILKMDRQFLAHVESDPRHRALCRSVLHLGSSLGLDVVVEGVETPTELRLLRDMGHRFVQGYLLARPTELAELPATLALAAADGGTR